MKLNVGSSLETASKTRFFIEDNCRLKYESKATWVKGSKYMPVTNRHSNSLPSKERGVNVLQRAAKKDCTMTIGKDSFVLPKDKTKMLNGKLSKHKINPKFDFNSKKVNLLRDALKNELVHVESDSDETDDEHIS